MPTRVSRSDLPPAVVGKLGHVVHQGGAFHCLAGQHAASFFRRSRLLRLAAALLRCFASPTPVSIHWHQRQHGPPDNQAPIR